MPGAPTSKQKISPGLRSPCNLTFWMTLVLAVHDCFRHAAGQDIFLLEWRQVLSYDVSLLNIRLVFNSVPKPKIHRFITPNHNIAN
jgi:hypothetical protein